MVWPDFI